MREGLFFEAGPPRFFGTSSVLVESGELVRSSHARVSLSDATSWVCTFVSAHAIGVIEIVCKVFAIPNLGAEAAGGPDDPGETMGVSSMRKSKSTRIACGGKDTGSFRSI